MALPRLIGDLLSRQFLKFLLVGGFSAGVNFGSRFIFQMVFPYLASVALAFCAGTVSSFILNRSFTFQAKDEAVWFQMVKYVIGALGAVGVGTFIAWAVIKLQTVTGFPAWDQHHMETLAHIISIGLTTLYNFFVIKYFSLKRLSWFSPKGS